ncbi:TetR family transcriptional regulator [Kribbella voronezhensis]|uniref:TetR family transcriptional regulator n=1 Tax=Kribbella voronezhensis TaxID=2512212 RepID=A0A4R7T0D2_9ACTN|nr:TetR/AcrR family transcriptional regulator [Kribbella voronezhensis]TDU84486.1 TetR family transcriptional regulator [Kribbella voronezhensis]
MARAYDSSARIEGARRTRASIVETARDLLLQGGYPGMTVASLATAAGVSPQTVYNSVGNKAAVVKAVYDQLMAGDDAAVPMSERPEFHAMFEAGDRVAFAQAYAGWVRVLAGRAGPLLGALLAHGTDATLLEFTATIEHERYVGTTHAITGLRDRIGLPEHHADEDSLHRLVDAVWTLNSPDCYDRLVRRRGWSPAEYETWLAHQLIALLS